MKIAIITPGFSASESDWCIPAQLDLVRRLAAHHHVHVFALRYPTWRGRYTVSGATVWSMGADEDAGVRRLPLFAQAARAFFAEHRRSPFDVVHGLWADEPGFLAALLGRLTGVPSMVSVMGGELVWLPDIAYGGWRGFTRVLSTLAIRYGDAVTVGSFSLAARAHRLFPGITVRQQPLGVDTDRFSPGPPARLRPRLLAVGSLVPIKGHETLLEAFSKLAVRRPDAELAIAGNGPLRRPLEARAEALKIRHKVRFLEEIDHATLANEYRQSAVHVLSSRFESQSMTALEAAACGIASAATPVGLLPQIASAMTASGTADSDALADAILTELDTPRPAQIVREEIAASYGLNLTVPRLVRRYQALRHAAR